MHFESEETGPQQFVTLLGTLSGRTYGQSVEKVSHQSLKKSLPTRQEQHSSQKSR